MVEPKEHVALECTRNIMRFVCFAGAFGLVSN
jgi:hypothetical protein